MSYNHWPVPCLESQDRKTVCFPVLLAQKLPETTETENGLIPPQLEENREGRSGRKLMSNSIVLLFLFQYHQLSLTSPQDRYVAYPTCTAPQACKKTTNSSEHAHMHTHQNMHFTGSSNTACPTGLEVSLSTTCMIRVGI